MEKKKQPLYPELEVDNYEAQAQAEIAEAEKKAAEIERQAKRDRDMALIGDMAHLVSQGAAMHGGAWKIGQMQNEGAKGNERLRVLREKNAAQTAAFAKERAALREAKRKEQNAQKLALYNAEVEQYKRAEDVAHRDALLKVQQQNAETHAKNAETNSGKEDRYTRVINAYREYLAKGGKPFRKMKTIKDSRGRPTGTAVDDSYSPSITDIELWMAQYPVGAAEGEGAGKKSTSLGWGKSNNKNNTDTDW